MEKTIGFIGGGRITRIFLHAFRNKGFHPSKIAVFDISSEVLSALQQQFPEAEITSPDVAARQDIVFISLHPPVILETLERIKANINPESCVISLAPKITIGKIAAQLNGFRNVARMIPNATSYINKGFNPVCFSNDFTGKEDILKIMELLGETFITDEPKMEAYAILSAMLPTYFWFQWNELQKIGTQIGLSEQESAETVEKTLLAAIETLYHSGLSFEQTADLIPVKPLAAHESQIRETYSGVLTALFGKIKP